MIVDPSLWQNTPGEVTAALHLPAEQWGLLLGEEYEQSLSGPRLIRAQYKSSTDASRQQLDVTLGAVHADHLPVWDQLRGVFHAHYRREAVLAGDHGAMGHQSADLGHQALDGDE